MDYRDLFERRIEKSSREVTIRLSERDFAALNLWHLSVLNSRVPDDFAEFVLNLAKRYLEDKVFGAPLEFQARLKMIAKDKNSFASEYEIETETGYKFDSPKRGLFSRSPHPRIWPDFLLGSPWGWGFFKPGWEK